MSSENLPSSTAAAGEGQELEHDDANYQPPPEKTIDDLVKADADDPALQRYKEALLGSAVAGSGAVIAEPDDPRKVIIKQMALVVPDRDDEVLDLTGDLKEIKKKASNKKCKLICISAQLRRRRVGSSDVTKINILLSRIHTHTNYSA